MSTVQVTESTIPFTYQGETYQTWYKLVGDLSSATRPPLIVLHGGPGMGHNYMASIADLASSTPARPVVFYDQIGCGKSTHLPLKSPEFWSVELFVAELENILAYLKIKIFDLLGHSWGGVVASEYVVRRQPEGLRHLILSNSLANSKIRTRARRRLMLQLPEDVHRPILKHEDSGAHLPASSQTKVSEDAKLLASLDIAGRQDEAVYKPNPWSIAKANAASRPEPVMMGTKQPVKGTGKPKKKPQGRIVDFLKKQAEALPAPDGKGLRPGLPPRPGQKPSARPKENLLAPRKRDAPVNHYPSLIPDGHASPSVNLSSAPSAVSDHGVSPSVRSNIASIDQQLALPDLPTTHIRPPKPHTSMFDASSRSDRFCAPIDSGFVSIPDPAPAFYSSPPPSHRPNFTDFAAYADSRRAFAGSSAQSHNALTSTGRLSDARVSANDAPGLADGSLLISPARSLSPVARAVPHGLPLAPPRSQPRFHSPATRLEHTTPVSQRQRQRESFPVFKSFSSPPAQLSVFAQSAHSRPNSAYIHPHRSQHAMPRNPSPRRRRDQDARFGPYRRSVEPDRVSNHATTATAVAPPPPYVDTLEDDISSGLDFGDHQSHIHPAVYSNPCLPQARGSTPAGRASRDLPVHALRSNPHIAMSQTEPVYAANHSQPRLPKRRWPSPTPSPSPSSPPPVPASKPNAPISRSAYAHPSLAPEQDEAWSTLQPRSAADRAGKTAKKTGIKSSGKFRVPLLLRGPARGAPEKSGVGDAEGEATAKKPRVVLYRPPPRAVPASDPSMEYDKAPMHPAYNDDAPTTSSRGDDDNISDPEPSADFDVGRVESRYPGVRCKMKE
ncbi:hypothetical protein EWM64_g2026 [Hericium alpestre]|uniref:AB hydrolase-1 domain-containing protein n=1 Tax=Hericium alpestre TaxID=135208 RepID=A0A4Z0A681_9AGAM|nr:hypothetical protein EWM64_g2026 [Hericium alpestre]